jgi:hypothetical protein
MTRRLVLATCLVGLIGGTATTALANQPVQHKPHQVCVVLVKEDDTTQDYCVDYGAATRH